MYPDHDTFEQCTPLGIHDSTLSKHAGKWRDRRREKHNQFSFALMNTTTQTRSLSKLKSNDFQSYPRGESAASCHLFSGCEN